MIGTSVVKVVEIDEAMLSMNDELHLKINL